MKIQILCTLGPASLSAEIIEQLDQAGVDLFRINLSHTRLEALKQHITLVQSASAKPLCLDLEGAQVRCGAMAPGVALRKGDLVRLTAAPVEGNAGELTLWPGSVFAALRVGSLITIDFDGAQVCVRETGEDHAEAVVVDGGRVRSDKGVVVAPPPALPALTDKDRAAIMLCAAAGIRHVALSFASSAADVDLVRSLAPGAHVIAKIESGAGVRNMDGIIDRSDAVLIDRGDLAREVPLEYVPFYQKAIVRRANRWSRPVYVATNLLESMVTSRNPTIAEANDVANTLLDGVHGLVLAAETAIGHDPVGIVSMVSRMIRAFEWSNFATLLDRDQPEAVAS
ncbi:MAG TPA: pyruvate kinase [Actinomycetes bacterium]|jgi:pyruvate kinase|nr:pyruvate kinase [Actinomycetes bacterium]